MVRVSGTSANDILTGTQAKDTLVGNAGDDSVFAGSGDDLIMEGLLSGNDTLDGGAGNDTVNYNDNNKTFPLTLNLHTAIAVLGAYTDTLISIEKVLGTKGKQDWLSADGDTNGITIDLKLGKVSGSTSGIIAITQFEHITGSSGNDLLTGAASSNHLMGGDGNDTLLGGGGPDTLNGGNGQDMVSYIGQKSLTLDVAQSRVIQGKVITTLTDVETVLGTSNLMDVITAASDTHGVTIDLLSGTLSGISGSIASVLFFEHIMGGSGNDVLTGNDGANSITGGGGNDLLHGAGGNDIFLEGGVTGSDTIIGGAGVDTVSYEEKGKPPAVTLDVTSGWVTRLDQIDQLSQVEKVMGASNTADLIMAVNDTNGITINLLTGTLSGAASGIVSVTGFEHIRGGSGKDTLIGHKGHNHIQGHDGNDFLSGEAGNDTLVGGAGADTLQGGVGNDLYVLEDEDDVIFELAKAGVDTVQAYFSYTLGDNIEHLTLMGSDSLNATGNSLNNIITGNSGDNTLDGQGGNDTLIGGSGNDTYIIHSAKDVIRELADGGEDTVITSLSYTMSNHLEHLILTGSNHINGTGSQDANNMKGNSGNNTLDGKGGADTMAGGLGNDTYVVDNVSDVVLELQDEGTDTVLSSVSYTLTDHVENLTLTGTGNTQGTGNSLDNKITGNAGNNTLYGGGGLDTLSGGVGDDTYILDNADQVIIEASGAGTDTVQISASYTLGDNLENLVLTGEGDFTGTGNALANKLTGNNGNNTLDGGMGADSMYGGDGDDVYYVDILSDRVFENQDEGEDTVYSQVSFSLGSNVEHLVLMGTGNLVGTGNSLSNSLTGNAGNNTLVGGEGSDTMRGGAGNDMYTGFSGIAPQADVIDDAEGSADVLNLSGYQFASVIFEGLDTNGDTFLDALSMDLGNGRSILIHNYFDNTGNLGLVAGSGLIETMIFGDGNLNFESVQALLTLTGPTEGNDSLVGTSGNDTLEGLGGIDTMVGLSGDDTYIVDSDTDVLVEADDDGTDTVESSVSFTLGEHFENLLLTGDDEIDASGNTADNVLTGNNANNRLEGMAGDDTLIGGDGDDVYVVDSLEDVIIEESDEGTDTVLTDISWTLGDNLENLTLVGNNALEGTGNDLDNVLTGNSQSNTLDGATGSDTMMGGAGDDTYLVDDAGDDVIELAGEGTDTVMTSLDYTLGSHLETLILTGSEDVMGVGNSQNNWLVGNTGSNTLDGAGGDDTLDGGEGDDEYWVDSASDLIVEAEDEGTDTVYATVSTTLSAHVENGVLMGLDAIQVVGNTLNNTLTGNDGNNTLDGGLGEDVMLGGLGDDIYRVDNPLDVILEAENEGVDTVQSSVSFTLGEHLENLVLTGVNDIAATGNTMDNVLVGNEGQNTLDGAAGFDTLEGGAGDDVYLVDTTTDTLIEFENEGTDTVFASVDFTLGEHFENLSLVGHADLSAVGNHLANVLIGNSGHNTLDGSVGADTLIGGAGNDMYLVDAHNDMILENPHEGDDTVYASVSFTLSENLEHLVLTGTEHLNGTGNAQANEINGNAGNNTLNGQSGLDTLVGGDGDDVYLLLNDADIIVENANGGIDTVHAAMSYTLGENVEHLTLVGADNLSAAGNSDNNLLLGNSGHNTLDGAAGADTMQGGDGDDVYLVDHADDQVMEYASQGIDRVQSTVNYTLGDHVENLTLAETAQVGMGNALNNMMVGNEYHNTLGGGLGNDTLVGGAGNDRYQNFSGETFGDIILDIDGEDVLDLSTYALSGFSPTIVGAGDLKIFLGTGQSITIQNYFDSSLAQNAGSGLIETILLADGVSLNFVDVKLLIPENQHLIGTAGDDTLIGGLGNDTVEGLAGHDRLMGGDGDNTLVGGLGEDTYNGGAGDDTYLVEDEGDIIEDDTAGHDTVYSAVSFTLSPTLEDLILTGSGHTHAVGNALNNNLMGNTGNNTLDGGAGSDTMGGDDGNDVYIVDQPGDLVLETENQGDDTVYAAINYTLGAHVEHGILLGIDPLILTGNTLNNSLTGNAGNNTLNGGIGADTMSGGDGDDVYYVDANDDVVIEAFNGGTDTVITAIAYTLGEHFENLGITGSADIAVAGNAENNLITGNDGNNTLDGGLGADTMASGLGNDVYWVDNSGDVVIEGENQGTDTVHASVSYTLTPNVEHLILMGAASIQGVGNILNNSILGNNGNNTLDGGGGTDTLSGGLGDDVYFIDATGDVVVELLGEGTDTLNAVSSYTLGDNLENLVLLGSANINGTGNALNNLLVGNAGNNNLTGGDGNDTLDGGLGNDTMVGGQGDDIYWVDASTDVIQENSNQGTDTVTSTISYTLSSNLEHLVLVGSSNINATGNSGNNTLMGNSGNNSLNGSTGNDTMLGGLGDDTYVVNTASDVVIENANEGTDTVQSSVSYTLGSHLEHLTLTGNSNNIHATGNGMNNVLTGNRRNNRLTDVLGGDDTLDGGAGNDTLEGGGGNDLLKGNSGSDRYVGFSVSSGHDIIDDLSGSDIADFTGLDTSDAIWHAIDGNDADAFVDQLRIDFGNGFSVTILNYFSNTHVDDDFSSAGSGCIESLIFDNDSNVSFTDVRSLIL